MQFGSLRIGDLHICLAFGVDVLYVYGVTRKLRFTVNGKYSRDARKIWGVIMRKDSPLAEKEYIVPEDLWDKPIIRSRQSIGKNKIGEWFQKSEEELNIVATGNLLYNMSLLVEEGIGYAVGLDKILNTTGNSNLCFRPLYPELISHLDIARKKYQVFPKCAENFLKRLQENI